MEVVTLQTFLPFEDFEASARVLDMKRLGKQRVEVLQILRAINNGGSWANHPAVRMWRDHTLALGEYGLVICLEWISRGYNDTCYDKIVAELPDGALDWSMDKDDYPPWLGCPDLHISHQSNLVRKKPEHYRSFFPFIPPTLEYYWPVT